MGLEVIAAKRSIVMGVIIVLQLLEGILYIVGLTGWSKKHDDVLATNWAYSVSASDNENLVIYGLRNFMTADLDNDDTSNEVDYEDCADDADYCKNCEDAGKAAIGLTLMGFFFLGGVLIVSGVRFMPKLDSKNIKIASIILILFQLLWSVSAIANWKNSCMENLPVVIGTTQEIKTGPGYNCIATCVAFTSLTLVVHLLMPGSVNDELNQPLATEEQENSSAAEGEKNQV